MNTILTLLAGSVILSAAAFAGAKVDEPAPAFTLKDAAGKAHSLADYKGKLVVLEWVNFGCPFVRKHYDSGNMQRLQRTAAGKGVIWLSICSSAPGKQGYFAGPELTDKIAAERSSATAYLVDEDGTVGKAYEARTTPHMFIIDPSGKLIYVGGIDDVASTRQEDIAGATNYVQKALDAALAGKPVETKTSKPYGCSVKYK
jgi:glutathione peroxidase-family protein